MLTSQRTGSIPENVVFFPKKSELEILASEYKKRNGKVDKNFQAKILAFNKDPYYLTKKEIAKKIERHPSLLTKWEKKLNEAIELNREGPHKKRPFGIQSIESRLNRKIQLNSTFHKSESIENSISFKQIQLMLPFLFGVFLLLELYLLKKGIDLTGVVFGLGKLEGFVFSFLAEFLPIVLCSIAVFFSLKGMEPFFVKICLFVSFVFSVYLATGLDVNNLLTELTAVTQSNSRAKELNNAIKQKSDEIHYYQNAVRRDGKKGGWPHRTSRLIKSKEKMERELEVLRSSDPKSSSLKIRINLILSFLVRFGWQLGSLVLSKRIFLILRAKGAEGANKRSPSPISI